MFNAPKILAVGHATSVFLLLSYLLCVAFGLLFPNARMVDAWAPLLPGFEWLSVSGFLYGLLGSYLYGWYIALVWVPLYGVFHRHQVTKE